MQDAHEGAQAMKKCNAEYFAEKYNPWASYTYTCEKADGHLGMHRDVGHGAWGFEKAATKGGRDDL